MPELPEVETIVRRLKSLVTGKHIQKINVLKDKSFIGSGQDIEGQVITKVSRRAKYIQFHLENDTYLLSHLKMTGQFLYLDEHNRVGGGHPTADWISQLPSKHTRVWFELSDNSKLFFNDQRIFGWIRHMTSLQVADLHARLAPDITSNALTSDYVANKLKNSRQSIKQKIMCNQVFCGVGNIYACDALNLAQVHPARPSNSLSLAEINKVVSACKQVINKGIALGGATISNYKHVDGFSGNYQSEVLVYARDGELCFNCDSPIVKEKISGRGTYYCPSCQV